MIEKNIGDWIVLYDVYDISILPKDTNYSNLKPHKEIELIIEYEIQNHKKYIFFNKDLNLYLENRQDGKLGFYNHLDKHYRILPIDKVLNEVIKYYKYLEVK